MGDKSKRKDRGATKKLVQARKGGLRLPGNDASWIGSIVVLVGGGTALLVGGHLVAPRRRFGLWRCRRPRRGALHRASAS